MNRFGLGFGLDDGWSSGLDIALRGSLVLATAWLLTAALRRRSASMRHLIWSTALVAVVALPLAQQCVPSWRVLPAANESAVSESRHGRQTVVEVATTEQPLSRFATASDSDEVLIAAVAAAQSEAEPKTAVTVDDGIREAPVVTTTVGASVGAVIGMIWLFGALVFCLPLALGTVRVWRLRRSSELVPSLIADEARQLASDLRVSRRVEVLLSSEREMPMTWGLLVPVLLLPASAVNWSSDRRRMVLLHELAHIRRWDCLTQLLGQFARALHWFNPLAWFALRRLRVEQERACDDVVLNCGTNATEYASELLSVTARLPRPTWDTAVALAMSRCSRIEQRLKSILDSDCERRPLSLRHFVATCGVMLIVTWGIAAAQRQVAQAAGPLEPQSQAVDDLVPAAVSDPKPVAVPKTELGFDNGDFEGTVEPSGFPTSWSPALREETAKFVQFRVEDVGHGGKRSASIAIDQAHPAQQVAYNWVSKARGWKVGQALEISAWVKTENAKVTPSMTLQCWNKDLKFLSYSSSVAKHKLTGTQDWTRMTALLLVPPETDQVLVRAILPMPGNAGAKVWFDDFSILEADAADAKAATHEFTAAEQAAIKQQDEAANRLAASPSDSLKMVFHRIAELSPTPVDQKALNEAAIRGMLQSLNDPYSTLITAEQMTEFSQTLDSKLVGIGAALKKEGDAIEVTGLVPNSPAMRGGLKPQDVIAEINGQPAKELDQAVKQIRGQAGTDVTLTIRRGDKPMTLTLKRGEVRLPSVKGLSFDEQGQWRHWLDTDQKIAFVQLSMFDQQTHNDLKEVLTRLSEQGLKGLILDLRGNAGGMLVPCVEVAKLFLKEGTIVQTRGRPPHENSTFAVPSPHSPLVGETPLIVLVNQTTSSAAEVLASALKDNGRATLLGERTFGKGSVQSILPLGNDGPSLRLTTALMFSASGQSLQRTADSKTWGVDPHDGFFVPLTSEQQAARQKAIAARESGTLVLPATVSPEFFDKEAADPQIAAALKALSAKLKTGEMAKTGRPLADQDALLSQRDDLRKQRDQLRMKLRQIDQQLDGVR